MTLKVENEFGNFNLLFSRLKTAPTVYDSFSDLVGRAGIEPATT